MLIVIIGTPSEGELEPYLPTLEYSPYGVYFGNNEDQVAERLEIAGIYIYMYVCIYVCMYIYGQSMCMYIYIYICISRIKWLRDWRL
jgi:hypothetical protein